MSQTALDFSAYIAERTHDFTGRGWVFAEIDRWLADPNGPRYFIITGEPGIGKTAIAARLTQIRELTASHFCIARQADTLDPLNFARSISAQLARVDEFARCLLAEKGVHVEVKIDVQENYGQIVGVHIDYLTVDSPSATVALNRAVLDPLRRLYAGRYQHQLVVLVDALDEAVQHIGAETIVDVLANTGELPKPVRFVLTSRPDGAALRHFQERGIPHLVLDAGREENQADVRAYVRERLATSAALQARVEGTSIGAFVEQLSAASKGNFLYLVWVLRAMAEGTQAVDRLDALPDGLDGIYLEFLLTRIVGKNIDRWRDRYRPVLGVLAAAQEPLTAEQLVSFTGLERQEVKDVLLDVQQFLDPIRAAGSYYRLYHQSVIDFLGSEERAGEFWIDLVPIHEQFAHYYQGAWGGFDAGLPELQKAEKRDIDNGYGLRHMAIHLKGAKRINDLHCLLALEREHRNVWYEAKEAIGDKNGFLDDVALAWNQADTAYLPDGSRGTGEDIRMQIRYALIMTSLASVTENYPPDMLAEEVKIGLISLEDALNEARRAVDLTQRSKMFIALLPLLPESLASKIMKEMPQVVEQSDKIQAARVPSGVYVPGQILLIPATGADKDLVSKVAQAMTGAEEDVDSIVAQAIQEARPSRFDEAWDIAQRLKRPRNQAKALVKLASYLSGLEKKKAINAAEQAVRQIEDKPQQDDSLVRLVVNLSEIGYPSDAWEITKEIRDNNVKQRAEQMCSKQGERPKMTRIKGSVDKQRWAGMLTELSPLLRDELDKILKIRDEGVRAQELEMLSSDLSQLPESILYPLWQETLRVLASHARQDLLSALPAFCHTIVRLGDTAAIKECIHAIQNVGCWWPSISLYIGPIVKIDPDERVFEIESPRYYPM
jgi:hypothetical protein